MTQKSSYNVSRAGAVRRNNHIHNPESRIFEKFSPERLAHRTSRTGFRPASWGARRQGKKRGAIIPTPTRTKASKNMLFIGFAIKCVPVTHTASEKISYELLSLNSQ